MPGAHSTSDARWRELVHGVAKPGARMAKGKARQDKAAFDVMND